MYCYACQRNQARAKNALSLTLSWVLSQAEGGRARKRQTAEKTREAEISPNYGQSWPKCFERYSCNCVNIVCDWLTPSDWLCVCVCWSLTCSYDLALWLTSACIPKSAERRIFVNLSFYFYTYRNFSSVFFYVYIFKWSFRCISLSALTFSLSSLCQLLINHSSLSKFAVTQT